MAAPEVWAPTEYEPNRAQAFERAIVVPPAVPSFVRSLSMLQFVTRFSEDAGSDAAVVVVGDVVVVGVVVGGIVVVVGVVVGVVVDVVVVVG